MERGHEHEAKRERQWRGRPVLWWVLVGLLTLLGVRGLAGGLQFILVPSGEFIGVSTVALASTPLQNYLVPGLVLFGWFGLLPFLVVYGLYTSAWWGWPVAILVGVTLVIWAVLEGFVIGFGERLQYVNVVYGVVVAVLAASLTVRTDR